MTDRLAVTGIECYGHHGVFDFERREGQVFIVDLVLGVDTASAAASDDLRDTVDYGSLVAKVKANVERDPVDLIETLAQRIADVCLLDARVEWARVTVHKPDAPIRATFSDVALTITRRQKPVTETPNPNIIDADTLTGEMRPIRRAVLALGSNLGERLASLQGAVSALADTPDVWVTGVSPVYETEAVDSPEGSPPFLNAVVLVDTTLSAQRILDRALAIEDAFDRERSEIANAPRTLDVDVIVVGDRVNDDEMLTLPHPRAADRVFVLRPWHDLEPEAEIPGAGAIAGLLEKLDQVGVVRRDDLVLELE
jgi:2-amino-4-hydroxy-6-hydroxymethyldihydropteridine diphosphokinase/dihydroneopterin aldolase